MPATRYAVSSHFHRQGAAMKPIFSTLTGGGKGQNILIVLLTAALHALAVSLLFSSPLSTPQIAPGKPTVTLELAAYAAEDAAPSSAAEKTADTADETVPAAAETPPPEDTLATEAPKPPPPAEKRPAPQPPLKARPKPAAKPAPATARTAAPAVSETAGQTSSSPSTASAPPAPAGIVTPASANAAHLNNPAPQYPALALKRKWQGTVRLRVRVLASGKPGEIQIQNSSEHHILDQAAIAAVRQWTFVPAKRDGVPQDSWTHFPLSFKLQ